jgi:hypothetical protein
MGTDNCGDSSRNDAQERRRALAAAFEGERPMGWKELKLPFCEENTLLTPAGREVAIWAADPPYPRRGGSRLEPVRGSAACP